MLRKRLSWRLYDRLYGRSLDYASPPARTPTVSRPYRELLRLYDRLRDRDLDRLYDRL